MYEVVVEARFTAAHRHPLPERREAGLHGHDFLVRVWVAGDRLEDDVLVDFHAVELEVRRHLAEIDHRDLSEHPEFPPPAGATPAAIAAWLYRRLQPWFAPPLALGGVEVLDGDGSGARYRAG